MPLEVRKDSLMRQRSRGLTRHPRLACIEGSVLGTAPRTRHPSLHPADAERGARHRTRAPYPALHRLEHQRLLATQWGISEAQFSSAPDHAVRHDPYRLTQASSSARMPKVLYGIIPLPPATIAAATAILVSVTGFAGCMAAWPASRVYPTNGGLLPRP